LVNTCWEGRETGWQLHGEEHQSFAALEARVKEDQQLYISQMKELHSKHRERYEQYDERAEAFVEVPPFKLYWLMTVAPVASSCGL
jgi:hypothetical protein